MLPVLRGERFAGRIEEAAQRLCAMNGLERVTWAE